MAWWFHLLKLVFKYIHQLAWLVLALLYPMFSFAHAIVTNSNEKKNNLISYWILLSLIYLFEYAVMNFLLWFHLWSYVKLLIIFWLIIPDFGRATYVYNLICSMKPQIVKCWRKSFEEKDNSLRHVAERYMKENGTDAIEKLIASKNTRLDAKASNEIIPVESKEMLKTNEEMLQTEHTDINEDLEAVETTYFDGELPQKAKTDFDRVGVKQKELTCGICSVKVSCEKNMHSHLKGKKHKINCAALKIPKPTTVTCKVCNVKIPTQESMESHIQGYWHLANVKSKIV